MASTKEFVGALITHAHTHSVQALMAITPAGSLGDVYQKKNIISSQEAVSDFPAAPPPHPEKDCRGTFFYTLSAIFLSDYDRGAGDLSYSHTALSAALSLRSSGQMARWSSARPAERTDPPAATAHDCLSSESHCAQFQRLQRGSSFLRLLRKCLASHDGFFYWR